MRCVVSVINIVYTLTIVKTAMTTGADTYVQIVFLVIALVDFYIRIHCQYYNDVGVIVTHPWYTAKNYITGAFILDLYANIPINFVRVHAMFYGPLRRSLPVTLLIVTRPFQIYRVYCGLEYVRNRSKEEKGMLLAGIQYVTVTCVLFLVMAAILEHSTCSYVMEGRNVYRYRCANDSWISVSKFGSNVTHISVIALCNYKIVTLFTTYTLGTLSMKTSAEELLCLAFVLILFMTKWLLLAKIISAAVRRIESIQPLSFLCTYL